MVRSTFFQAGAVLLRAKRAIERIPPDHEDRQGGSPDALDSIVFAAAACEAFINELPSRLRWIAHDGDELKAPLLIGTADVLEELEEERASCRVKFKVAKLLLGGAGFDPGGAPFQDYAALVRLRDQILHLKIDTVEHEVGNGRTDYPKYVRDLESKRVLAVADGKLPPMVMPWTALVGTRAVARWAINSACAIVRAISALLPLSAEAAAVADPSLLFVPLPDPQRPS